MTARAVGNSLTENARDQGRVLLVTDQAEDLPLISDLERAGFAWPSNLYPNRGDRS